MKKMASSHQEYFRSGYERGSVASTMNLAERRRFYEWLKQKNTDGRVLERQLGDRHPRGTVDLSEV